MTPAFTLEPLEPKRDKRFEFPGELPGEANERLASAVTSYGVGTRSYNRSPEKRELDRQCAEATANYEAENRETVLVSLMCACLQRPYPHELAVHTHLWREAYDRSRRYSWPWALCLAERLEPSTEKEAES
jgi:hypothetical protein